MSDIVLELKDIYKSYGDEQVLKGINLSVRRGEFITFLGPSGCGKTTTLRIIGGLTEADSGSVVLNGQDVTGLAPNLRNVNTVFQNYALFPHMNVAANIGYGLRVRGVKKAEISARVGELLALVQLEGFERRRPTGLSGGQRQRVAIARALILNPDVLLLDEPLGALDLQLRRQMQSELKALQRQTGVTFVYITHDQEEALGMSSRVVVMREGEFCQIGTPDEVYGSPATRFVAEFIGFSNFLPVSHTKAGASIGSIVIQEPKGLRSETICVRPENVEYGREKSRFSLPGVVRERSYTGGVMRTQIMLDCGVEVVSSRSGADIQPESGARVEVVWSPESAMYVQ